MNPLAVLEPGHEKRSEKFLNRKRLKEQYGTVEFGQILFEPRLKTSQFSSSIETLLEGNQKLSDSLKKVLL